MSVKKSYDSWAGTYDGDPNRTRDLDARVLRKTFAGRTFDAVLELGCGTGKNTALLSRLARTVDALDFSDGMLARAKEKLRARKNVRFARADLTKPWPARVDAFDLICCDLVLEHVKDLRFVFKQARRALRPDGLFFISELHPYRQYGGGKARFIKRGQKKEIAAFVHSVSDFIGAALAEGFTLRSFEEPRHAADAGKPPRLAVFLFEKDFAWSRRPDNA